MNTKGCSKCSEVKDFSEFDKDCRKPLGISSACSLCRRKQSKERYDLQMKDPKHRAKIAERMKKRNNSAKEQAVAYKGGSCMDCGITYPIAVYDFHHIDPAEKEAALRDILRKGFEAAKPELDKCVLLCSNCHRLRHFHNKE